MDELGFRNTRYGVFLPPRHSAHPPPHTSISTLPSSRPNHTLLLSHSVLLAPC